MVLQVLFAGVTVGMIYALIALGFHLIYKGTGVINFAQGEFALLGSMLMWFFWVHLKINGLIAFPLAVACGVLAAVLIERITYNPLRSHPHLNLVLVLLAVATIYTQGMLISFGHDPLSIPSFWGEKPLDIFGAYLNPQAVWVAGVFVVSLVLVQLLFTKTMWGRSMVATMINAQGARIIGINVDLVSFYVFALSAAIAAGAGAMIAPITGAYYSRGMIWTIKGFTAGIVGGMDRTVGVVVGGLLVGIIEISVAVLASNDLAEVFVFLILIVILLIRPSGILGSKGNYRWA